MAKQFNPFQHIQKLTSDDDYFLMFPNFLELMEKWKGIIQRASTQTVPLHNILLNGKPHNETYEIRKEFYDNQEIAYIFDVIKAGEWVQEHLEAEQLNVSEYQKFIFKDELKRGKEKENKKSPIIFVQYEQQLINGNHRMTEAYEKGVKFQEGFVVLNNIYIDWMITDYMKRVYQLNQDIDNIHLYLNKKEQGHQLQWDEEEFTNRFLHISKLDY
ncbi:hypothetical protein [Cytobacillus firmus]|uniref:hypothetical protein n=1 Tax=Cytobacillus firmus TaxID=1399 RepID=UPI0021614805|nr:hypothetical protein [Cytobacillus firmus]MCS0674627.1 hypothetical protein [Cytobacillus firmus]